jgi:hypothetical protein
MYDDLLGDVEMVCEGAQFYIVVNGNKIAKRESRQWTNLVFGYSVEDLDGGKNIAIDVDCSKLPSGHREPILQRVAAARRVAGANPAPEGLATADMDRQSWRGCPK